MARANTSGLEQIEIPQRAFKVLRAVAESLAGPSNQREMIGGLLAILRSELGLVSAEIMLLAADGREPDIVNVSQDPYESRKLAYQDGFEAIRRQALDTARPVLIRRVQDDHHFIQLKPASIVDIHDQCLVCVPILCGGRATGVLSAFAFVKKGETLDELESTLGVTAAMLAGMIWTGQRERGRQLRLNMENLRLKKALGESFSIDRIIGESGAIREICYQIKQVALEGKPLLIRGEMGAGKALVASVIHYNGPNARNPLVSIDCPAADESRIEAQLFGRENDGNGKAGEIMTGQVEQAEGGTLLLEEIGALPPAVQVRLIRLIQDGEFQRVGAFGSRKIDVRVVATSYRDPDKLVADGRLLPELYDLFKPGMMYLAPLRERRADILPLVTHFFEKHSRAMDKRVERISPPAVDLMLEYHWPGNVRELEDCVRHALAKAVDGVLYAHHLPPTLQPPSGHEIYTTGTLRTQVQRLERDMIIDTLKRYGGSVSKASQELGITARMVRYKIKSLEIDYIGMFKTARSGRD